MDKVNRVILFCDIHDFGLLSGSLGDGMPGFVQAFYEMVGAAVQANGGQLVKYIGDSVLALFPGGAELEAVRCALRMRGEYARLPGARAGGVASELEVSIGSGPVVEGIFGHESLRLRDVFGETVCNTAMIMHFRGVALTREVRGAVQERYPTERLPDRPLRWLPEPLEVWRVVEER